MENLKPTIISRFNADNSFYSSEAMFLINDFYLQ